MSTILYTSLSEINSFNPCASGWKDILKGQNKTQADDVLFPLIDCVDSNSFSNVCWLLGKRKTEIEICVNAAKMCADSVAHVKNRRATAAYAAAADAAAAYAAYAAAADATAAYAAAADAAAAAAYAAAYAYTADADAAYQNQKNKQFLRDAILTFQSKGI